MTQTTSLPFDRNADRFRSHADSIKGRMRGALIVGQLEAHIPAAQIPLRVLDAGCGTGDLAAVLIRWSKQMTLLDFSAGMLEQAGRRLAAPDLAEVPVPVRLIHGCIEQVDTYLGGEAFDLILCHNVLEYVDKPRKVLGALAARLSKGGYLSLVAANRYGEVFKNALVKLDLDAALACFEKTNTTADLFDGVSKRTFLMPDLEDLAWELGLNILGGYGIRMFTDWLPGQFIGRPEIEPEILKLERAAGAVPALIHTAHDLHLICRKQSGSSPASEGMHQFLQTAPER
ncbi:MAG: methyltransferase domain-containing protein [Desulfobacteraceae bacterium]|nr:MAG: methyltransferase domain-containing protein [Desulfobacteraceae bacterium]